MRVRIKPLLSSDTVSYGCKYTLHKLWTYMAYTHLSNQLLHRRITVPPEKLAILPDNGSDRTGGENQEDTRVDGGRPPLLAMLLLQQREMFTLGFSYFSLSPHTLLLYFKSRLILFSVFLYHFYFLTKEKTLNKNISEK